MELGEWEVYGERLGRRPRTVSVMEELQHVHSVREGLYQLCVHYRHGTLSVVDYLHASVTTKIDRAYFTSNAHAMIHDTSFFVT